MADRWVYNFPYAVVAVRKDVVTNVKGYDSEEEAQAGARLANSRAEVLGIETRYEVRVPIKPEW